VKAIRTIVRFSALLLIAAHALVFLLGCGGGGTADRGAISGVVIAPGDATAPVYVLAVKYEN